MDQASSTSSLILRLKSNVKPRKRWGESLSSRHCKDQLICLQILTRGAGLLGCVVWRLEQAQTQSWWPHQAVGGGVLGLPWLLGTGR